MRPSIEKLLAGVEMTELVWNRPVPVDSLYATHEGTLLVHGYEFKVVQLNDGQRAIEGDKVDFQFLELLLGPIS